MSPQFFCCEILKNSCGRKTVIGSFEHPYVVYVGQDLKLKCMDLQVYIYSHTNRYMFIRMLFLYDLYNEIELALHNVKKGKIYLSFNINS